MSEEVLLRALNFFAVTAPLLTLSFLPFRRRIKYSIKFTFICVFATVILASFVAGFIGSYFEFNYVKTTVFNGALSVSLLLSVFVFASDAKRKVLFIIFLSSHIIFYIFSPMSSIVSALLFNQKDATHLAFADLSYIMIIVVQYALLMPIMIYIYMTKITNLIEEIQYKRVWDFMWILPAIFFVAIATEYYLQTDYLIDSINCTIFFIASITAILIVSRNIVDAAKSRALEEQLKTAQQQLLIQRNAYAKITESMDEVRNARHDLRHHLITIDGFVKRNEFNELSQYLSEYMDSIPVMDARLCENNVANNILQHYLISMRKMNIKAEIFVPLKENCGINDLDLCIILGNCLENAVEASEKITVEQRYMSVKAKQRNRMFSIVVENAYDGGVSTANGRFVSRKSANRLGIGLKSVKDVTVKYDGIFKVDTANNFFRVSVFLNLPADNNIIENEKEPEDELTFSGV